jgi:glycerophosphoryl diester phosphodiesterase
VTSISTDRRPLLLGHRGARRKAPENTLAAFDLALAHGCDGFEFDVRRTLDGRSLVCHDPRLRTLEVARHSHSDLLRREPAACCLEDVLGSFASRAYLDIELKVPGLERSVIEALGQNPPQHGYVVSSFAAEVVLAVRDIDPRILIGFICDRQRELAPWASLPCQVVIPNDKLATRVLVDDIHSANREVFVWTVNQEKRMRTLAEWGVDAIISDDTALLARTLRS